MLVILRSVHHKISDALVSLEKAWPSLSPVRLPNPRGPSPYLQLTTPNLGNLASRLQTKKQIRDATQNKTTGVVYRS